jgi:hypothetical protein
MFASREEQIPITVQLCGESIHPVTSIHGVLKEQRLGSSWQQKSGCGVLVASHLFLFQLAMSKLSRVLAHKP